MDDRRIIVDNYLFSTASFHAIKRNDDENAYARTGNSDAKDTYNIGFVEK